MDSTPKMLRGSVTKYDVQLYSDVYSSNLGVPTPLASTANDGSTPANKKRRLSPPNPDLTSTSSGNDQVRCHTPASSSPLETMSLQLIIPGPVLTKEDHRTLAIRRVAAERWKPKLQRPFPKRKEINEAYKLKLMRHYASATTSSESNFIRPHIDVSPRVNRLRAQFPRLCTSIPSARVLATGLVPTVPLITVQDFKTMDDHMRLRVNKDITRSERVQRLAWKSFSATERDRVDRGREAMMESGLVVEDLVKESRGAKNGLPEWKKCTTGRFAKEKRSIPK